MFGNTLPLCLCENGGGQAGACRLYQGRRSPWTALAGQGAQRLTSRNARPIALELQHFWTPSIKKRPQRSKPSTGSSMTAQLPPLVEMRGESMSLRPTVRPNGASLSAVGADEHVHREIGLSNIGVASRDPAWRPTLRETQAKPPADSIGSISNSLQNSAASESSDNPQTFDEASLYPFDAADSQNTEAICAQRRLSTTSSICDYPIAPLLNDRQNADMEGYANVERRNRLLCIDEPLEERQRLAEAPLSPSPTAVSSCDETQLPRTPTATPPAFTIPLDSDCPVFDEWPLQDATLKRVVINGVAVLQLQFEWPLCATHAECSGARRKRGTSHLETTRRRGNRVRSQRSRFTPEEDTLLQNLKESYDRLSWREIHRQFSAQFRGRTTGALQVRYCTKLKGAGSRS